MVLVDELFIPHRDGTVRVRLDPRLTVFAGLPPEARTRLADRLVSALACVGPACVQVRDDQGRTAVLSTGGARTADGTLVEGPVPSMASSAEALARLMVVRAVDLGLDPGRPARTVQAEWTAMSIDHRQLVHELGVAEAGAEERRRLEGELGDPGTGVPPTGAGAADRSTRDAVAALGPRIDELLRRRAAADQLLVETAGAVRAATSAAEDPATATGPLPNAGGGTLVSGLRAAVSALRRVESRRRTSDGGADADDEAEQAAAHARAVLRRAADDLEGAREAARAEIAACDRELADLADRAGIAVGPDGPGAALTEVLARGDRGNDDEDAPPSAPERLLRRRREVLRARIAELPSEDDVAAARRRMEVAAAHLARLEASEPALTGEVATRVRTVLLGRAASLRPQGTCSGAPLVLDDPLVRLVPDARCDLLDVVLRVAQRVQVVLLTDDAAVTAWARHRADHGELRLIDLAPAPS